MISTIWNGNFQLPDSPSLSLYIGVCYFEIEVQHDSLVPSIDHPKLFHKLNWLQVVCSLHQYCAVIWIYKEPPVLVFKLFQNHGFQIWKNSESKNRLSQLFQKPSRTILVFWTGGLRPIIWFCLNLGTRTSIFLRMAFISPKSHPDNRWLCSCF